MSRSTAYHTLVLILALVFAGNVACANESTAHTGIIGLNAVPSARMDAEGTVRAGVSTLDPHNHAFLGMQIAKPLYINLRQSMGVSSIGEKPSRVYPGMDIKLRLKEESRYAPEISFGMDSALGHQRFSSEYFALSKRFYDFDFTGGIAWGRMGSAGQLGNPLGRISSHFKQDRDFSGQDASSPSDWFTGKNIGLFGGVEYFTPLNGLSLKADFNADDYPAETRETNDKKPSPWSVGFNYSPKDWLSLGASWIGGDKLMARLTFQTGLTDWNGRSYKEKPDSEENGVLAKAWGFLKRGGDDPKDPAPGKPQIDGHDISQIVPLNDYQPSSMQIGRAARDLLKDAKPDIQTITIVPITSGVRGKAMTFSRRDLEQTFERNQGSPEEIWNDLEFSDDSRSIGQEGKARKYKFIPELSFSLGEEETTHLYRASAVFEEQKRLGYGFTSGSSLRLNLADNLHRLMKFKDINLQSVRGDADLFTYNRVNVDRAYLSWMKTVIPDFHLAVTAGYLEEMYAGYGGEIMYRPFDSPFALGAEAWNLYKRDGLSALALATGGDAALTGHLNLYYDIPDTDLTTYAKIGQFIGGDRGASVGVQKQYDSGLKLKGFVTATNARDKDVFDSDRNLYAGLQLSLPIGNLKFIPQGSEIRASIAPIGRDDAQIVDKPVSLYDVTEPMSYRHLGRNWQGVQN